MPYCRICNLSPYLQVRLIDNKKGSDVTFDCPSNKFILDEAEVKIPAFIPWSCRAGSCSSCIGLLKEGSVDQSTQIFLDDKQIDRGYDLTCVAYPQSDCTIVVNCEDEFYNSDVKPL